MGQRRRRPRRQIFFYVQHKGNARLAALLALSTFAALAFLLMDLQLRPQIREWGQARARYLATQAINQAISQELEENGEEYQDLVRFEKDQFGQILAVQTDVVKVNTMKSRMIARVSQKLNDAAAAVIRIPLGNATGMDALWPGTADPIADDSPGQRQCRLRQRLYQCGHQPDPASGGH